MLFPSNPNSDDIWRPVDERMQRLGIDRYKETQENTTSDGRIIVDDLTESKFLMSEDGYGHSRVSGVDQNGNQKTISTMDKEKAVFEVVPPPDSESPAGFLEIVYDTLKSVIDRTKPTK